MLSLNVAPLCCKIALGLQNRAPDECVQSPTHFRHPLFKMQRLKIGPEFLDKELAGIGLNLVVARSRGVVREEFVRALLRHEPLQPTAHDGGKRV